MAAFEKISDEMLENIAGGSRRIINTRCSANAAIRKHPGMQYALVNSIPNGKSVEVDEDSAVYNATDGRTWYHISFPVSGWIVGKSIGLPEQ